jgi:hypothetical protein
MTSERTLNQVRAILSKLDRSIDEAREKRTHPVPRGSVQPTPNAAPAPGEQVSPVAPGAPGQTAEPAPRAPSPFGRARPLNRPPGMEMWRV